MSERIHTLTQSAVSSFWRLPQNLICPLFFFESVSHLGGSLNALASELPQPSCHSLGSHYTPNSSTPLNHTCRLLCTSKWKTEHIKIYPVANIIKKCTQKAIGETKKWSDVDAFGASFVLGYVIGSCIIYVVSSLYLFLIFLPPKIQSASSELYKHAIFIELLSVYLG